MAGSIQLIYTGRPRKCTLTINVGLDQKPQNEISEDLDRISQNMAADKGHQCQE